MGLDMNKFHGKTARLWSKIKKQVHSDLKKSDQKEAAAALEAMADKNLTKNLEALDKLLKEVKKQTEKTGKILDGYYKKAKEDDELEGLRDMLPIKGVLQGLKAYVIAQTPYVEVEDVDEYPDD